MKELSFERWVPPDAQDMLRSLYAQAYDSGAGNQHARKVIERIATSYPDMKELWELNVKRFKIPAGDLAFTTFIAWVMASQRLSNECEPARLSRERGIMARTLAAELQHIHPSILDSYIISPDIVSSLKNAARYFENGAKQFEAIFRKMPRLRKLSYNGKPTKAFEIAFTNGLYWLFKPKAKADPADLVAKLAIVVFNLQNGSLNADVVRKRIASAPRTLRSK